MARVRVFLPTYRRPSLLPRAIASLRAQTMTDWVCELHNDAPDDATPGQMLARLGDPRFEYHPHARNLGGTATFNLVFRGGREPFYAMLEDDNAWSPDFLATMLKVASDHPDVSVFWCNQSIWREETDGVHDTGRCVHHDQRSGPPQRILWGHPEQIFGARHAHGAALFRSIPGGELDTPAVPIALVEAFRERRLAHPLVFVPQPLAQFTVTLRTARSDDRGEWAVLQTMLAATFLKHARSTSAELAAIWRNARNERPRSTNTLLSVALVEPACRKLLRHATAADHFHFARATLRRPTVLRDVVRSREKHADWWAYLDRHTAERFAEARKVRAA